MKSIESYIVNESKELDSIWQKMVDYEIATDEEIKLCTQLCGYTEETLNKIIYARCAYHDIEQFEHEEGLD